jgi:nucleotide-binding universal stress UspA family protein
MADPTTLGPGSELDGFRIDARLHEGGMALLYAVSKPGVELPLAMKVPRLAFGAHAGCLVGFEVEQMLLGAVAGVHVPRLVATGTAEDVPYLVMERIEGPSLADLARRAPLPAQEVARLVSAVAAALHDLHRQNVIHLDVKPANVIFRPSGEAVLVDFGIARHGDLPDLVEEEFHTPVGTGACIAPEQLAGERSDPRSDLFALGVAAYQLATGAKPFGEPTTRGGMRGRLYVDPLPPRALNPSVPPWLQEIILRCLEVLPEDRYATAAQLAHDLAHPDQVTLTERASRLRRRGAMTIAKRWLTSMRPRQAAAPLSPAARLARAPQVLVAVDPDHRDEALAEAMRDAVRRALAAEPGLRLTFMTVYEPQFALEDAAAEIRQGRHVQALMELRHWVRPLALPPDTVRFHVAEGSDAAAALLDYAAGQHADRIIMGARTASPLRRYLGSVSSRVVAEAPCSVSVIRPRRRAVQ